METMWVPLGSGFYFVLHGELGNLTQQDIAVVAAIGPGPIVRHYED